MTVLTRSPIVAKLESNTMYRKTSLILTAGLCAGAFLPCAAQAKPKADYRFTSSGDLVRPTGYREWIYVGTPVTPNDMNDGKAAFPEFHNVYIAKRAWAVWKKTGTFPDGTILMKELVGVGTKAAVSGRGYFQGNFLGLEAVIKDKKRFPKEPGNWAYFSFTNPKHKSLKKTAKAFPTAACNSCHQVSAKDDFVFTQYYPVLTAGKKSGRAAVGGVQDDL